MKGWKTLGIALWSAVFMLSAQGAVAGENVAVIIGNSDYRDGIPDVAYAGRDAAAIKAYLTGVRGFDAANIIELRNATKAQMEATFGNAYNPRGRLWRYADPEQAGEIFVFFSGHGVPGLNDQRRYLLPVDAEPDFADISGYPISQLFENLKGYKNATIVLDACFSGNSAGGTLFPSSSGISISARAEAHAPGLTVLTAAGAGQLASWDHRARHGLFTEYFLRGVYGEADLDLDGHIRAGEMKTFLDRDMTRIARRTYGREQDASLSGAPDRLFATFSPWAKPRRPQINETAKADNKVTKAEPEQKWLPPEEVTPQPQPAPQPPAQNQPRDSTTDLVLKTIIKGLEVYRDVIRMDRPAVSRRLVGIRSRPEKEAVKIGRLRPDQPIRITGRVEGTNWLRVLFRGGDGYIKASALSPLEPGELRLWRIAQETGRPRAYRQYVKRFPDGHFVNRAHAFLRGAALTSDKRPPPPQARPLPPKNQKWKPPKK